MDIPYLQVIGYASFMLTAVSIYVRDMLMLRGLAIVAGLVGIVYNYLILVGPLWLPIFWLSVFIAINTVRIIGIVLDRRSVAFNEEEAKLLETVFKTFLPVELMQLMRIGEWQDAEAGEQLAAQGDMLGGSSCCSMAGS